MERKKVIVSERIAEEGLALLRTELDVDFRDGISREDLLAIIDQYDALIVRSVTRVDEELIKRAARLKVVGRAMEASRSLPVLVSVSVRDMSCGTRFAKMTF